MTVSVIGCGQSAKDWHKTPFDFSVGVNDCIKFGKNVNTLVLINAPFKFEPTKDNGYQNRLKVILSSLPGQVLTNLRDNWKPYFQGINVEGISLSRFGKKTFQFGNYYHTQTSTFVALLHAVYMKPEVINLFGCDLVDHPNFPVEERETKFEIEQYLELFQIIGNHGIKLNVHSQNQKLMQWANRQTF